MFLLQFSKENKGSKRIIICTFIQRSHYAQQGLLPDKCAKDCKLNLIFIILRAGSLILLQYNFAELCPLHFPTQLFPPFLKSTQVAVKHSRWPKTDVCNVTAVLTI